MGIVYNGNMGNVGIYMKKSKIVKNNQWSDISSLGGPDERNRVSLTPLLQELNLLNSIDGFKAQVNYSTYEIKLIPTISIPHNELWLYKNPEALNSVLRGMEEAKNGKIEDFDMSELDNVDIDDEDENV